MSTQSEKLVVAVAFALLAGALAPALIPKMAAKVANIGTPTVEQQAARIVATEEAQFNQSMAPCAMMTDERGRICENLTRRIYALDTSVMAINLSRQHVLVTELRNDGLDLFKLAPIVDHMLVAYSVLQARYDRLETARLMEHMRPGDIYHYRVLSDLLAVN